MEPEVPSIVRRSSDGRHTIEYFHLGEIRFGPAYYSIALDGLVVKDLFVGEEGVWLSSSYYAAQEWLTTEERFGPNTRLLLINADSRTCSKFNVVEGGFVDSFDLSDEVVRYRIRKHKWKGESLSEEEVCIGEIKNWIPVDQ